MAIVFGYDASGRGNNWTANNLSSTAGAGNDSLTDTPTSYGTDTGVGGEVRGNYCTLNPLYPSGGTRTFANGNLEVTGGALNANSTELANWQLTTGKWYFEGTVGAIGLASITQIGTSVATYYGNGTFFPSGSGASYTTNDVIGVAADIDAGTVQFYKNGVSQGTVTGTAGTASFPAFALGGNATPPKWIVNFGQRAFAYTAPSGFKALCTQNLPTPTIGATSTTQADNYFGISLYTGTGSQQSITGLEFQPDFFWTKGRSAANSHVLINAVSGPTKFLASNNTDAEVTTTNGTLVSFNSNGVTLQADTNGYANFSGRTYVAWQWRAAGSTVSNTAGTITSTVSANTTSGFSIVTYTGNGSAGATIGHGLGVKPAFMIFKYRGSTVPELPNWYVYHQSYGATKYMYLNTTAAVDTSGVFLNNTEPTSSLITLGVAYSTNDASENYVAYVFAPVAGYSAFGSYTGNGSADGPFVYTGFRPRYVLVKRTDTGGAGFDWFIWDTARSTYNAASANLTANQSVAEGVTAYPLDINSNGLKITNSATAYNASGGTYIYAAFAESPFKYALAR